MKIYERHCFLTDLLVGLGVSKEVAGQDTCRIEHMNCEESFQK